LAISSFARASKILKGEAEGVKFNFPVVGTEVSFSLDKCSGVVIEPLIFYFSLITTNI
jgi:hypothetical protein